MKRCSQPALLRAQLFATPLALFTSCISLHTHIQARWRADTGEVVTVQLARLSADRMRGNGIKLLQGRFRLDIKKNFSEGEVLQWHSCPGRWWSHCPWRCSRTVQVWHRGTW